MLYFCTVEDAAFKAALEIFYRWYENQRRKYFSQSGSRSIQKFVKYSLNPADGLSLLYTVCIGEGWVFFFCPPPQDPSHSFDCHIYFHFTQSVM